MCSTMFLTYVSQSRSLEIFIQTSQAIIFSHYLRQLMWLEEKQTEAK